MEKHRNKISGTGAAEFIGSAVRPPFIGEFGATVHNIDKLTGAASIAS